MSLQAGDSKILKINNVVFVQICRRMTLTPKPVILLCRYCKTVSMVRRVAAVRVAFELHPGYRQQRKRGGRGLGSYR